MAWVFRLWKDGFFLLGLEGWAVWQLPDLGNIVIAGVRLAVNKLADTDNYCFVEDRGAVDC